MKEKPTVTVEMALPPLSANVEFHVTIDDGSVRRVIQPVMFVGSPIHDEGAYQRPSFMLEKETAVAFLRAMAKAAHDMGITIDGDTNQSLMKWPTVRATERIEPYHPLTEEEQQKMDEMLEAAGIPVRAKEEGVTREVDA
jgi:hypothetical protein